MKSGSAKIRDWIAQTATTSRAESPKKSRIRTAAYRAMNELGFHAASYSEIAERSGYGRPLVQMYFPKKGQFILDMIEDSINLICLILDRLGRLDGNAFERTLRIAQAYFSLTLRDEQALRLTREILAQRSMMKSIIGLYQIRAVSIEFNANPHDISTATIKALGGVEELIVDEVDKGNQIDPDDIACQLIAAMKMFLEDGSYKSAYAEMQQYLLPRQEVHEVIEAVADELLSPRQP